MRGNHFFILTLILCLFSVVSAIGQGSVCEDIEPFCAGSERLTFPNSNFTNTTQQTGEFGPDYACLDEQPYPSWFYLQVEDEGDLQFRISQYANEDLSGAPLDVDFVIWGPFEKGDDFCTAASLSSENIVDCSYLPDAVETMTITGASANAVYVVVITNFEENPGFISLQQISGDGSTDCSILGEGLGEDISVCGEEEYSGWYDR
ncbi:hypothetical protein [Christiangramia salexigens]|uniref:Uncharacterized protein n=1 Tax=Christiangramia salexigens TaxID=1913577 RepID=A0A1L3J7Z5_9FLAO|nr:hypothetical protein [Christiangramia salexigens]APG61247.1 hypothetical protein LPB144_12895 [Christiangramia salexigens]